MKRAGILCSGRRFELFPMSDTHVRVCAEDGVVVDEVVVAGSAFMFETPDDGRPYTLQIGAPASAAMREPELA